MRTRLQICFAVLAMVPGLALADDGCPTAVKAAIAKAMPKSTIAKCKAEKEHGREQWVVKLTRADGVAVEADVATDGTILQLEEPVAIDKLPAAVAKAFGAKYPKAKPTRAEKQTPSTGPVSFEIAFEVDGKKKEATFTEAGKFIEEE